MELYLLRHGIAEDAGPRMRDEDRRLTNEGRERLTAAMRTAAKAGVRPTLILTSPLVRAVETAEIAATQMEYTGELVRSEALTPDADPAAVWSEIRQHRDERQLLLASHNPLCQRLPGYLLNAPELGIEFKKAGLLRVDFESFGATPRGVLQWLLTPRLAGA